MRVIRKRSIRRVVRRAGFAAGLLAVVYAGPARAQGPGFGGDPEERLARLQEELDLSDAQVEQLRTIFAEQRERMGELRQGGREDRRVRREAFMQLREETRRRIGEVLTEEQIERFEEIEKDHPKPFGRRGGPRPGRGPGGRN